MSLTINTNIGSMILLNHLGVATQGLNDAIESMTSGYKINHAKDNAANFGIVTNLTTRINSLQVREDNASLGLELVSTASSGIENIANNLQKIRSLAMSSVNGTYGNTSLASLQQELKSRLDEIQRTTDSLSFENRKIFNKKEPTTKISKSRALNPNTQTVTSEADKDTTFAQLGINDLSLDLYYANGNKMNSLTLDSNDKIDKLLTILNGSGFSASISNGVIKIDSSGGNYIKGGLADALGITTSTKTLVTNTTSSSNNKITYTTTAFADATTTFAKAGLNLAGKTLQIKSKADNSELGTITVDNNSETFQDLFDALANYNITATIKNGKISFSSSDKYITGDVASILGITTSSTNSTTTTGQTTTSSNAIQYTITSYATTSNTLADLGIASSSLVIENNTGTALKTISVSATTNLGDLFNTLATNSVTASLTNGVISVSGDNVISGVLAEALGITKSVVKEGESTTTGIEYTSDTVYITLTTPLTLDDFAQKVDSLSMPEKDTLLKDVTYIDASKCEDIVNVTALADYTTYKITSTEGLKKLGTLKKNSYSATVVLMDDIDLSTESHYWKAIEFSGDFYGNGHTISNLTIEESGNLPVGTKISLFTGSGDFSDLIIKNANIKVEGDKYTDCDIGILTSYYRAGRIENISVSGSINFTETADNTSRKPYADIAGLCTEAKEINACNVNININKDDLCNGSIGGIANDAYKITNCAISGSITNKSGSPEGYALTSSGLPYAYNNKSTIKCQFGLNFPVDSPSSSYYADNFYNLDLLNFKNNKFMNTKYLFSNNYSFKPITKLSLSTGGDLTLEDIGITNDNYIIINNSLNKLQTIMISKTCRVNHLGYNLNHGDFSFSSFGWNPYWSITPKGTSYIVDVSDDMRNILGLDAGEGKTYNVTRNMEYGNSTSKTLTGRNLTSLTNSSKLSDIGITSNKTITVSQNGNLKTVTVKSTDTVDNLISKLSNVGITATLADGKLSFAGSKNAFIKDMSSELATAFGVSVGKDKTYSEATKTSYTNNQSNNTYKSTSTQVLTTSSMLNQLKNLTNGAIRVRNNSGVLGTINVTGTNSIQDFFNKIKNYGITGSITDGKVTLSANGDSYLETVTGGSNLLKVLDMGRINQAKSTVTEHSPSKNLTYKKSLDDWTMYDVDIAIGGISNDADYKIGLKLSFGINYALDITTKAGAEKALSEVDNMLKYLQGSQTDIGSAQNRLLSVLDEISVQYENLVSSRSTLRDADLAKVSSKYLRNQIMQQAATTLLSVANQNPSIALGLI